MPRLVLLNGAPGSGKSTQASLLAAVHPMMLALDIDRLKHALGLWDDDPTESGLQARRLAARGVPALRIERHHCGDGAGLEQLKDVNPYTHRAVADIELGAGWLHRRTGEQVTGVGLCMGGWLVAMAPPGSGML